MRSKFRSSLKSDPLHSRYWFSPRDAVRLRLSPLVCDVMSLACPHFRGFMYGKVALYTQQTYVGAGLGL